MALGFLGKLVGSGAKEVIGAVGSVVDKLHTSEEEKTRAKLELEQLLQEDRKQLEETLRIELQAKERILVAELTQGDEYTKRARPTVVYAGLAFIFLNYVISPLFLTNQVPLELPVEFWFAWGGIVGTWSIGRTFEKSGVSNKATRSATGSKRLSLLD